MTVTGSCPAGCADTGNHVRFGGAPRSDTTREPAVSKGLPPCYAPFIEQPYRRSAKGTRHVWHPLGQGPAGLSAAMSCRRARAHKRDCRAMNILIVVTSHDQLGPTGKKTGIWLEEFAAPYYAFTDSGATVIVASPKGGKAPVDPLSETEAAATANTARLVADTVAQDLLAHTKVLWDMRVWMFDAVFYPGGHGSLWDLPVTSASIGLLRACFTAGKPVATVGHGCCALRGVMSDGHPVVKNRRVTGFSDSEEAAMGLTDIVPFSVEANLRASGGLYEKAADWQSCAVIDNRLVTGQNPASARAAAELLLAYLAAHPSPGVITAP